MFFSASERRVFPLPDLEGKGETRYVDPLRVRRLLLRHTGGLLDDTWEKAAAVSQLLREGKQAEIAPEMLHAEEVLLAAARLAFELPDFDPKTGLLTDADVWTVLNSWSRWVGKCAGEGGSGPTPSPHSPEPPSAGPSTSSAGSPST